MIAIVCIYISVLIFRLSYPILMMNKLSSTISDGGKLQVVYDIAYVLTRHLMVNLLVAN